MREKLTVIKVGGKIVEEEATLRQLLNDFAAIEGHKVLVHGGGRSATKIAAQLGIESKMVNGRRITDVETLKVVTMVYGGLVNKSIVAGLQARGVNALGLTGADMNVIRSVKRPVKDVDYGFVGDVEKVDATLLSDLIHKGVVPVMAPLTHDGQGNMLNTNADTIAGETAKALSALFDVTLVYCFEKKGVLRDENDDDSVIPQITRAEFEQYVADGVIQGGMIPKLENSFEAINAGVSEVIITLASAINENGGTKIKPRVVKQIINSQTGEVKDMPVETTGTVISKETSQKVLSMMESVVSEGTGKNARVAGYRIGGKTGTSEDGVNTNKYVTSFCGVAPIDDPQVVVLVTLYNPTGEGGHQGGGVAAPVGGQIFSEVLPYLEVNQGNEEEVEIKEEVVTPDVLGKTLEEANKILKEQGLEMVINNETEEIDKTQLTVKSQVPQTGIKIYKGNKVYIDY